jgi:hypothetical protein
MLLPRLRIMTFTLSMAMGCIGICPGSAQSLNAQYNCPFSLYLGGVMLLHLTGVAAALVTKLIGSTNIWVPLSFARISLVQLVGVLGVT